MARFAAFPIHALTGLALALAACQAGPPPPAPWFNEHIRINETSFPPGVRMEVTQDLSDRSVDSTDNLLIANESATALYLAAMPPAQGDYSDEIGCPDSVCLMAVSGHAYEWPRFSVETPEVLTWEPISEFDQDAPITLYISGSALGNGHYTVLWIDLRNEYFAPRPPDVEIPAPQDLTLPYIYGSDDMGLSLTVSYTLNQSYARYGPVSPTVCLVPLAVAAVLCLLLFTALFSRLLTYLARRAKSRRSGNRPVVRADAVPPNTSLELTMGAGGSTQDDRDGGC